MNYSIAERLIPLNGPFAEIQSDLGSPKSIGHANATMPSLLKE
jgi:hypothetical protein